MRLATSAAMFTILAATLALAQAVKSDPSETAINNQRFPPDCVEAGGGKDVRVAVVPLKPSEHNHEEAANSRSKQPH